MARTRKTSGTGLGPHGRESMGHELCAFSVHPPIGLVLYNICTFCLVLCTLRFDLCTLCLWCYLLSTSASKYSTCTHGGGHWLQLALVAFFLQPLAQTLLAPVVVPPIATSAGILPSTHWCTYSTCAQATCTVWYVDNAYQHVRGSSLRLPN